MERSTSKTDSHIDPQLEVAIKGIENRGFEGVWVYEIDREKTVSELREDGFEILTLSGDIPSGDGRVRVWKKKNT